MAVAVDGLESFRSAVVGLVVDAAVEGARDLLLVDPDFADWPLEDRRLLESLAAFTRRPGRRVLMLARDFERVRSRCPRFVAWRTLYDHAVVARQELEPELELPSALVVDRHRALRLLDREFWPGQVIDDPVQVARLRQEIDARMQRAAPAFGATTLGL